MSRNAAVDEKCIKSNQTKKMNNLNKKRSQGPNNRVFRDWINRSMADRPNEMDYDSFWANGHNQKLFQAMSDPAVCGYSVPFGYPFDQMALPVYPVIPATMARTFKPIIHSYSETQRFPKRPDTAVPSLQKDSQYTSLPPGSGIDCGSDQRRRFSDPGLANAQNDDCSSSQSSEHENEIMERMSKLASENQRLTMEIHSTKEELQALKAEVSHIVENQNNYRPGSVIDIVKDLEKALGVRQEAMLSKTKLYAKEYLEKLIKNSKELKEKSPTTEEFEDLKKELEKARRDRDELKVRLDQLEENIEVYMKESRLKASNQSSRLLAQEQQELKIRKQIQEGIDAQKITPSRIQPIIARRISNSVSVFDDDKIDTNHVLSSLETESLASSIGSGPVHSPIVSMSGPVTDV